jgi:hypothetical protein
MDELPFLIGSSCSIPVVFSTAEEEKAAEDRNKVVEKLDN